jgi:flagellar hook-basal body complex protein FliE
MSQMAIDSVLSQIRALQSAQKGALGPLQAPGTPAAAGGNSFASVLKQGLDKVNEAQVTATRLGDDFVRGKPGVELGQVMVEMQKASVAFRATTEVRNRCVAAYQEIMNMPI